MGAEILNIPGGAQFLLNQLAWQQQQANHVGKRSATLPAVPGAGQWWQRQLPALTTPTAISPPSSPWDTSTLPATLLACLLLSVPTTPTAPKQQVNNVSLKCI